MPKTGWKSPLKRTIAQWNEIHKEFGVTVIEELKNGSYLCRCNEGHEFERVYLGNKTGCPKCAKQDRFSNVHKRLMQWLERVGIDDALPNYRKLIAPKEIDVFLPKKKVAIEVDGVYWHSSRFMADEAAKRSARRAQVEQQGVRFLRFWDFEFLQRTQATLSFLRSVLGLNTFRIGARECEVTPVESAVARDFLDKWHMQGATVASVNLGLFYQAKLVAVMTFRRPSISKKYDWEMARFAVKGKWNVAGGASKLFKHFLKDHSGSVVSYADRRYSTGDLYRAMGFTLVHVSKPGYFYYHQKHKIVTRYQAQKHKLKNLLGDRFDSTLSEYDNMTSNNFHRVYDCGQFVFVFGSTEKEARVPHVEIPKQKTRAKLTVADVKAELPDNLTLLHDGADDEVITKKSFAKFSCVCGNIFESEIASLFRRHAMAVINARIG
jgi:very-short-patch-repair endonuclease